MSLAAEAAPLRVKICGLRTREHVQAACGHGAAYIGFVFFPPSPRAVAPSDAAALGAEAPAGMARVGLFVDPDDAQLDAVVDLGAIDMVQLHGDESPERVAAVRARLGLPVIKAIGVGGPADLALLDAHEGAADMLMPDAKPAPGATVPGGTGHAFEWSLLAGRRWRKPWLLAGGLTAATVREAAAIAGAQEVDVSSGVERVRGEKSSEKIEAFLTAAGALRPGADGASGMMGHDDAG